MSDLELAAAQRRAAATGQALVEAVAKKALAMKAEHPRLADAVVAKLVARAAMEADVPADGTPVSAQLPEALQVVPDNPKRAETITVEGVDQFGQRKTKTTTLARQEPPTYEDYREAQEAVNAALELGRITSQVEANLGNIKRCLDYADPFCGIVLCTLEPGEEPKGAL